MTKPADSELYNAYLQGSSEAYDQLMIRYGDSLTFYLYGYLHDWQDSEDLMIEAFSRIMVKRPRIGEGAFKAYLFRTARNLASRFHAGRSRIKEFSFEEYNADIAASELVEEILADKERERILHECLKRIDQQQREALWLVYFEGMRYAEAASVMGVNTKKVDHLLTRGKKQMRTELEKEGITDAY